MPEITIDDLTIKQAKHLAAQFGGVQLAYMGAASCGESIPVLVCTDKRGVVFGYTNNPHGDKITLTSARMCLYWSSDVGGVFGLAEKGPTEGCKISAPAPAVTLSGITAVFSVDDDAVKAWTKAPVQGR